MHKSGRVLVSLFLSASAFVQNARGEEPAVVDTNNSKVVSFEEWADYSIHQGDPKEKYEKVTSELTPEELARKALLIGKADAKDPVKLYYVFAERPGTDTHAILVKEDIPDEAIEKSPSKLVSPFLEKVLKSEALASLNDNTAGMIFNKVASSAYIFAKNPEEAMAAHQLTVVSDTYKKMGQKKAPDGPQPN